MSAITASSRPALQSSSSFKPDALGGASLPRRALNTWLSAAIVSLMLLGIVGGAWWFGPGHGAPSDDELLRLAALTSDESTPKAIWPEPLTPDEAPWIAMISPDECTAEPLPYSAYTEAKTTNPGPPTGSWEIVGVPDPEDAQEVVVVLRSWLACGDAGDRGQIHSFYSDEYLFYLLSDFSIDNAPYREELDQHLLEAQQQWTRWASDIGLYPISVIDGIAPPDEAMEIYAFAEAVLKGDETYNPTEETITYMEARYDPLDAVLLADGRIMIPTRYVYWAEDPWGQHYGFSAGPNMQTAAMVLEQIDGEWKIDEPLTWICFGECEESPGETLATPVATPQN